MNDRSNEALLARRAIAEKATPGPWDATDLGYTVLSRASNLVKPRLMWLTTVDTRNDIVCQLGDSEYYDYTNREEQQATGVHIAANSPDVVMADIDEILRLRELVDGYKVSTEETQEIINELDREADWLADQMQKMYAINGKGKTKCIRGAKEWRELAQAAIETQPAAKSTTSNGPSWSWSKQDA